MTPPHLTRAHSSFASRRLSPPPNPTLPFHVHNTHRLFKSPSALPSVSPNHHSLPLNCQSALSRNTATFFARYTLHAGPALVIQVYESGFPKSFQPSHSLYYNHTRDPRLQVLAWISPIIPPTILHVTTTPTSATAMGAGTKGRSSPRVVCCAIPTAGSKVLLVTSRKRPDNWVCE
jgi:hypothetical protein